MNGTDMDGGDRGDMSSGCLYGQNALTGGQQDRLMLAPGFRSGFGAFLPGLSRPYGAEPGGRHEARVQLRGCLDGGEDGAVSCLVCGRAVHGGWDERSEEH